MHIYDQLRRPFPAHKIHWRVGNTNAKKLGVKPWQATEGSVLAYVDARDVMSRLDKVVGCENWQCRYPLADSGLLICEIGIRASIFGLDRDDWIWKANGAGDTQVEAEKGKCSDSFKRAAVNWSIAQYLYALPFQWIKLDGGQIPKGQKEMLGETLPHWATPAGFDELMAKKGVSK
jgi:hypothetical protein